MILILTNADTEILALRTVIEGLPDDFPPVKAANPERGGDQEVPSLDGVTIVVVRLLGGLRAWKEPFEQLRLECLRRGIPLVAMGGEAQPDAEMAAASTVGPEATMAALSYFVAGGLANLTQLLALLAGRDHAAPEEVPAWGIWYEDEEDPSPPGRVQAPRPLVAIVFYRAHVLSGNTGFIDDLVAAVKARGANVIALWCYSLRRDTEVVGLLAGRPVDVVITTVLAAGMATHDGDGWDGGDLSALGIPVVQAVGATNSVDEWRADSGGLRPLDVAMSVAIPEFDGRIISVPFSFKEVVDDGDSLGTPVTAYRTVSDRVERVAGTAIRLATLRHRSNAQKRVAIVLSAYPTKRSRLGNAVGLDTPASVIDLLAAMAAAGYAIDRIPSDHDALMAELADSLTYEEASLTPLQNALAAGRWDGRDYAEWFATLPGDLRHQVTSAWGEAPGQVYIDQGDLLFSGIDLGNVLVVVQPPRGFGANPIAVYHSPDLAPTHHYLAFYRWLELEWGADAVIHAGKHGTLEWLPGKGVGLSAACAPDAALGDLAFFYPFVVNDPGEGTQAKRRAHATIIDHLVPPLTRADTYDDLARLEGLLDTYAQVAALDPDKLPAISAAVWDLLVTAEIHRDLGVSERPAGAGFDDLILHVDGYLCELKDAQIRGGLHILGRPPNGEALVDMVLALTRLPQGTTPPLRALPDGSALADGASRHEVDDAEAEARHQVGELAANGWRYAGEHPTLKWVSQTLVPALSATTDEITNLLAAIDGRAVPAGPSGAPSRGMAHVLPTGRNFYSVDPKAIPSRLAWDVGWRLADEVVTRHRVEEGRPPSSVGLVVWGTATMRTGGDDVAEALALLGVRPVWAAESGRVTGTELIESEELGRPRVDVTLRISGFFRDAFPHVVTMLDDAVRMAGFDDDPRIFGAKPGAYGSGILPLLDSGAWSDDDDLAAVYMAWGGWSYGRAAMGAPAAEAMARRLATVEVAIKNQDNREHDIFDSDDYLQDHGGMVATIRSLTGTSPKAWFGDSSNPARPRVRSLAEEAARVVRTRVVNPKWIAAMQNHGYKGAFEMAATVDYLFGYDATARVVEDWMYEKVTAAYVGDPGVRKFFEASNPWALRSIAEKLLEAQRRGLWSPSAEAQATLRAAMLEAEGWEEGR